MVVPEDDSKHIVVCLESSSGTNFNFVIFALFNRSIFYNEPFDSENLARGKPHV